MIKFIQWFNTPTLKRSNDKSCAKKPYKRCGLDGEEKTEEYELCSDLTSYLDDESIDLQAKSQEIFFENISVSFFSYFAGNCFFSFGNRPKTNTKSKHHHTFNLCLWRIWNFIAADVSALELLLRIFHVENLNFLDFILLFPPFSLFHLQ